MLACPQTIALNFFFSVYQSIKHFAKRSMLSVLKTKNCWSLCDEIFPYLPESKNILKTEFPFKSDKKPPEAKIKVA